MPDDYVLVEAEPLRVVSVRRLLADQTAVARALSELLPQVADVMVGPPMALQLGFSREGEVDFELAFPVREGAAVPGFVARTLPAAPALSFAHEGALSGGPEGENYADAWRRCVNFVRGNKVLIGDPPYRFIYHEGLDSVGSDRERVRMEVQLPFHLRIWLDGLERGVLRVAGEDAVARVMAGSEGLARGFDGERAAVWIHEAIERLDAEVPEERDRACILNACAHRYILQSGEVLKEAWDASGHDLRQLVGAITDEPLLGNNYWIDETGPEPRLMIERRSPRPEEYERATDPVEKRYLACFCPLVRDAIRDGKEVSRTFCHCSGGWFVQEWEIVFGEKPEVDLVATVLAGDDSCVFSVRIPQGFL
jgi:hypothetical protein